jgi:Arc/MetJ-type ribon-helix-helix transcriptional regulator
MSTISVPLTPELEKEMNALIKKGYGSNKADVMRKALEFLAEEEAVQDVLRAEKELSDGKLLRGDLKKLAKKFS